MSSSSSSSSTSANRLFGVGAATAVGAVLRLVRLGAEPLWLDEATTAAFAGRPIAGAVFAEPNHPPLFTLLEHLAVRVGLGGDAGLRLVPAACGIALVPATAALARRLGVGRPATVAWLVATAPLAIFFAREARGYALLALLLVLATSAFVRVRETGRGLVGYALLCLLALHTHYLAAPALLAHEVAFFSGPRPAGRVRPWLAARGVVALACLPWALWTLAHVGAQARPWIGSPLLRVPYAVLRFAAGYGVAPVHRGLIDGGVRAVLLDAAPWTPAVLAILAAWIVGARALRAADASSRRLLVLLLALPWAVVLALAPLVNLVHERYLAWQVPLLVLLGAAAIDGLATPTARRRALGLLVGAQLACALPVLVGAGRLGPLTVRFGKEQWRDAATIVDAAAPDLVVCAPGYLALALDRYRRGPAPRLDVPEGGPAPPLPAGRIALIVSHGGPAEEALAAQLAARGPVVTDTTLPAQLGIRVLVVDAR